MNNNEKNDYIRNNIITTFIIHLMDIIGKSLVNYFYLPKGVEGFNIVNPKFFPKFSEKDIDIFKYDVRDLEYLSNDFATLVPYTLNNKTSPPNRNSLISTIKGKPCNYFYQTILRLFLKTTLLVIIIYYKIVSPEYYCLDDLYEDVKVNDNNNLINSINNNITFNDTTLLYNNNNDYKNSSNNTYNNSIGLNNTRNDNIFYNNKSFNNKELDSSISKKKTLNSLFEDFWYCKIGKCKVVKKRFSIAKILRIVHIICFYLLLNFYEHYLFFSLKRLATDNIYILFVYKIIGYFLLIYIFYLNFNDDKICSCSKTNQHVFVKENNREYNIFILLVNFIYSLL